MTTNGLRPAGRMVCIAAGAALAALLGGCLQTAPVVSTPDPDPQSDRMIYRCADARTLDVTRIRDRTAVILSVDGYTQRLPRDRNAESVERYANRQHTLTLSGNGATYETPGRAKLGPCSPPENDGPNRGRRRNNRPDDID